ncbi:MAG: hypothetical protein HQK97_03700 [Nitrospirae bacterium]|nr:hypothetical protein [Nitrospirota bacterium]
MSPNYDIKLKRGLRIAVSEMDGGLWSLQLWSSRGDKLPQCIFHWGVCAANSTKWQQPPESFWLSGTKPAGAAALQTPFTSIDQLSAAVTLAISGDIPFSSIEFVLFFPTDKRWDNNNGKNYRIELQSSHAQKPFSPDLPPELPVQFPAIAGSIAELTHTFDGGKRLYAAVTNTDSGGYALEIYVSLTPPVILHWGVATSRGGRWLSPPPEIVDVSAHDGAVISGSAGDSPFDFTDGIGHIQLKIPAEFAPAYFTFVLHLPSSGQWLKCGGQNFYIPIAPQSARFSGHRVGQYADEIISAEMGGNSWTLMHRFNLCYNICERIGAEAEGFALLTVWLRYSAIRQLDWQRNYNTQPRELSHAEDRLTLKLTNIYINTPQVRPFIPLMLMTMGPGGDGQRIRDEILQIMHRHRIKEVSGHFLEEWHQKLHNNATADDVVICEAYLAFLRSNGDLGRFYDVLNQGGVTRERLRSFERPIRTDPDFVHHIKDGLIHDFENYLKTLKAVHCCTDLDRAIRSSSHLFDNDIRNALHFIGQNKEAGDTGKIKDLFATATWVRGRIRQQLNSEADTHRVREMLLLDLSLVEFIRLLAERCEHLDKSTLVELVILAAENITLSGSGADEEIAICVGHLRLLPAQGAADWVLHVISVTERLERILGGAVQWYYDTFQEKAEFLGRAFNAAQWTINLFTEELLRGQPPFVLSLLLRRLNQVLRMEYKLGQWQVISPFTAIGKVVSIDTLHQIADKRFDTATVVIAGKVAGDEEIPGGVTAVISPDMTDIVSHVAVRARNAHVLFATCYDATILDALKSLAGRYCSLTITQSGGVAFNEIPAPVVSEIKDSEGARHVLRPEPFNFTAFALSVKAFNRRVAGGKSNNLAALAGRVPDWISLPPSVVIPFGAMEKVLSLNQEADAQYRRLQKDVTTEALPRLRALIEGLIIPDDFMAVSEAVMSQIGVSYPAPQRQRAEACIKKVWASLWNERAYLSRVNNFAGNPHEGISMAVLIQEIVKADYAFVIHTVNPVTGAKDEIFAEVVLGLGETLVGNHPGRALSFTCKKDSNIPNVAAYPGKSFGLYADGLIFRSDSNVEDLSGFAGAGLYDSVTLREPKTVPLDYSKSQLLTDEAFRVSLLSKIKEIGVIVENSFGSPQDIEGAYANGQYYVLQSRPQVGI